jgi:hypothetical protein
MACGVLTENGVAKSSSIFMKKGSDGLIVKIHPKIKIMQKHKEVLADAGFTMANDKTDHENAPLKNTIK